MKYRFKRSHRQYKAGDEVPESFGSGVIATLVHRQIAEPVAKSAPENVDLGKEQAKAIVAPPADKAFRPHRAVRKAVGA